MKKGFYLLLIVFILSGIAYGMVHLRDTYDTFHRQVVFVGSYLRFAIEDGASNALAATYVSTPKKILPSGGGIPVLLYHGIVETPDRFSLTQERFAEHVRALKGAGYETISMADFSKYISGENVQLPAKPFLLTFDDGRKDSFRGANPILALYDFNATMFLPTALFVEQAKKSSYYMSTDEIDEMVRSGRWEIQSHAIQKNGGYVQISKDGKEGNLLSNRAWLSEEGRLETPGEYRVHIARELVGSWETIARETKIVPIAFSYPFGDYGQQSVNYGTAAQEILHDMVGDYYRLAFRQVWPTDSGYSVNYPGDDVRMLRRIEPSPTLSGASLVRLLEGGHTKSLPYVDTFTENEGWKVTWGELLLKDSSATLAANSETTGAFTFLDGSFPWENYRYVISGKPSLGAAVTLIGRYVDQNNFASCTFDNNGVWIESFSDHARIIRKGLPREGGGHGEGTYGLRIGDNMLGCELDGEVVVAISTTDEQVAPRGGVGIQVWAPDKGNAKLALNNVRVEQLRTWSDELHMSPLAFLSATQTAPQIANVNKPAPKKQEQSKKVTLKDPIPLPPIQTPKQASSSLATTTGTTSEPTSTPIALYDTSGAPTPFIEQFATTSGWRELTGIMSLSGGGLQLQTVGSSTGATFFLKGADAWQNYRLSADVRWVSGKTFSVIARSADDRNYVECAYNRGEKSGTVVLYAYENGTRIKLFQHPSVLLLYGDKEYAKANIGITVKKNDITCNFSGNPIIAYQHPRLSPSGGIGFRAWDITPGGMVAFVSKITVEPI